jgi:hypothetical protein
LFLVCTWSLAKRIAGAVVGKVPVPALLVSYIGDVRAYEARAVPGGTNLSDPGHPRASARAGAWSPRWWPWERATTSMAGTCLPTASGRSSPITG